MDKFNRSVGRAIEILELLAGSPNELTITEISKNLGIPKSTAFDIVYDGIHNLLIVRSFVFFVD